MSIYWYIHILSFWLTIYRLTQTNVIKYFAILQEKWALYLTVIPTLLKIYKQPWSMPFSPCSLNSRREITWNKSDPILPPYYSHTLLHDCDLGRLPLSLNSFYSSRRSTTWTHHPPLHHRATMAGPAAVGI